MSEAKKNKEFIVSYVNSFSSKKKTRQHLEKFVSDEGLIEHILFFDAAFPEYELIIDEIIAEGNRVIMRARMKGKHEGELNGIPPTHKSILFPLVVGYEIENQKIISHWLIADQTLLMEQLGIIPQPQQS